jgi:hypothetical protein
MSKNRDTRAIVGALTRDGDGGEKRATGLLNRVADTIMPKARATRPERSGRLVHPEG